MNNNSKTNLNENKQCTNCGAELEPDNNFCKICGTKLEKKAVPETTSTDNSVLYDGPVVPYYDKPIVTISDNKPKKKSKLPLFITIGFIILIVLLSILSSICFHDWNAPTCTSPSICQKCSKTKGEALGHDWASATCTTAKTCKMCNLTDGDASGHNITNWKTKTESSCSKAGEQEGICEVCKETITESLPLAEHTDGEWTVTKKATATSAGEKTLKCSVCDAVIETKEFKLSEKEIKAEYIKQCKTYSYSDIARNPNKYDGKYAKFTGEIIQVQQEELLGIIMYVLRVDVTWNGSYYEDTIYVTYFADENDPRLLEDDIVTMYGKLTGEKTYETVLGSSITIPSFSAEYIETK